LLFVAVGERLGWDIRLVAVPHHNFVRWHLSKSEEINWDWTDSGSLPDSQYLRRSEATPHWAEAGVYLVSLARDEMLGYYLGEIGTKVDQTPEGIGLLERASRLAPKDPSTANNLAWAYAVNPNVMQNNLAISLALQAWAVDPDDANVIDTVACSFAAGNEFAVAEALEKKAISGARSDKQQAGFKADLDRISSKSRCLELSGVRVKPTF
jgi:tetratricopeptide (TPR) repeat protein